jgi:hypothetical protein
VAGLRILHPLAAWIVSLAISAGFTSRAHDVITTNLTWSREVSRIVYRRCAACHAPGGSAFSLLRYPEARPWAQAIQEEVLARRMPPWSAVKGFGDFLDDASLTQEEIKIISSWVDGGGPEGDERLLPEMPEPPERARTPARNRSGVQAPARTKLARSLRVAGIRPLNVKTGASLRAIAERPDGVLEPLLWIHNYDPRFPRTYYYRTPVILPADTIIQIEPPHAGAVELAPVSAAPQRLPRRKRR